MHRQNWRILGFAAFSLALTLGVGQAQETVRVRGTLERMDGDAYIIKTREGNEYKVMLTEKPMVVANVKASMADIKPGSYVGVTGMPQADGSQRAVEVHIFMESMRGTGEGHYAWDLQPQSTMTNGNVEQAVTAVDGQSLTVKYKDGEKKIAVVPQTSIVSYAIGDMAEIKPGIKIFIAAAKKQPDGSLLTPRINYGRDGIAPPM
jgi:hypothetical protein